MTIYATPGQADTAFLTDAPTGLVGTLGFKIVDSTGTVVLAPSTAGITEIATGQYAKPYTAPSTAGDYLAVWTNGATPITEELTVTSSIPVVGTSNGLVSLADLKTALGIATSDTTRDARLTLAIADATAAIHSYTDRDFATDEVIEARSYHYDGKATLDIDDCHFGTITAVSIDGVAQASTAWAAEPDRRSPVHYWLVLPTAQGISPEMGFTYNLDTLWPSIATHPRVVAVTATWGWPTVPADVRRAAIYTASAFAESPKPYVSRSFESYTEQLPNPLVDDIPERAQRLLDRWQRIRL